MVWVYGGLFLFGQVWLFGVFVWDFSEDGEVIKKMEAGNGDCLIFATYPPFRCERIFGCIP